ncbi:MAG: S-adenosylmethionine decarboxylase [Bacteroidales bacterium]
MENIKQSAEIHSFQSWVDFKDIERSKQVCAQILKDSGFNVLNYSEQLFPGGGFTAIWLLGESHLAIHLFMPEGKMFFDLASCNKNKSDLFSDYFRKSFAKEKITSTMRYSSKG